MDNIKKEGEEKQSKISDFTTIALTEKTVKEMERLKRKIKNETSINITNENLLTIILDCLDESKINEKIKMLKEGIGR